jgi:hypothetical protein
MYHHSLHPFGCAMHFEIKHFSSMTSYNIKKPFIRPFSFGQGLTTHLLSWLDKQHLHAKFGYKLHIKVKTFQHPFVFLATYLNHHV